MTDTLSLIERLYELKLKHSCCLTRHVAIDDCIAIVRQHQAEQSKALNSTDLEVMGTDKALIESKEQAKLGIAPEAAGLEPSCDRPVPTTESIGTKQVQSDTKLNLSSGYPLEPLIEKLKQAKSAWTGLLIPTAWEQGREAGFHQAFAIIQSHMGECSSVAEDGSKENTGSNYPSASSQVPDSRRFDSGHSPANSEQREIRVPFEVESKGFEEWAAESNMPMQQHPLHYLFLDERTYLARQAWKAAVAFMNEQRSPEPVMSEVGMVEAMATALNDSKEMENQGFSYNERLAKICFKALSPYLGGK